MSSDSERDDAFDEDMEALRRACMITGTAPEAVAQGLGADSGNEDSDDLDLPHSIQQRFSIPTSEVDSFPVFKPLMTALPSDSDEDDFGTLEAIQRRFDHYCNESTMKKSLESVDDGASSEPRYLARKASEQTLGQEYSLNGIDDLASTCGTRLQNVILDPGQPHGLVDGTFKGSSETTKHSLFPKSCLVLVNALKKNRSLQKFVRSKMMHIEAKIAENKDLRDRIKCLLDFQAGCKRRAGKLLSQKKDARVRLISLPKRSKKRCITVMSSGPAENCHVENYRMIMARFPVSLTKQPWSNSDKENLVLGIKQQYQEMMLLDSMALASDHQSFIGDLSVLNISSFGDCDVTSKKFGSFLPLVNWERLASMYFPGRMGAECEARWLNSEDPLINNNPWTGVEEKKLLLICQERGVFDWIDIACRLGTQRTPFQCLVHYQRSLNVHILKNEWTEEEDDQLREAVETFGENWQLVASSLEGRSGTQCSNRWRKTLQRQTLGRWSIHEDRRLKVAVMLFGAKNWSKIAQFIPGRSQAQCRERWVNCLDPSISLEPWSKEEDSRLKDAIEQCGYCWSEIATYVSHRTDSQCRRRWKVLFPDEVPLLRAARKMQKAALISNFVDREEERPLIGPSDFQLVAGQNSLACQTMVPYKNKKFPREGVQHTSQPVMRSIADAPISMEHPSGDGHAGSCENSAEIKKGKRKYRTRSKTKGKRSVQKDVQQSTTHAETSSAFSNHEPEHASDLNGFFLAPCIDTNHDIEMHRIAPGEYSANEMTCSQTKLCEYSTTLRNGKRGRFKLLPKRVKSSQQNRERIPCLDPRTHCSSEVEAGATDNAVLGSNESSDHSLHESPDDHMKLSEFIAMVKKEKKCRNRPPCRDAQHFKQHNCERILCLDFRTHRSSEAEAGATDNAVLGLYESSDCSLRESPDNNMKLSEFIAMVKKEKKHRMPNISIGQ